MWRRYPITLECSATMSSVLSPHASKHNRMRSNTTLRRKLHAPRVWTRDAADASLLIAAAPTCSRRMRESPAPCNSPTRAPVMAKTEAHCGFARCFSALYLSYSIRGFFGAGRADCSSRQRHGRAEIVPYHCQKVHFPVPPQNSQAADTGYAPLGSGACSDEL